MKTRYLIASIVLAGCFLSGLRVQGQETAFPRGLYLRLGFGAGAALNQPAVSPLVDPLILINSHAFIPYELQWQVNSHIGIAFQFRFFPTSPDVDVKVREQAEMLFPGRFVTTTLYSGFAPNASTDITQINLAISYAFGSGKWQWQPRIMIGGTNFPALTANIALKEQDSNQLDALTLQPYGSYPNGTASNLSSGAGLLVQRDLWRRWSIFGLGEWTAFKSDISYMYSIENQINHSISTQILDGGKRVTSLLYVGAGLTFRLTRKK